MKPNGKLARTCDRIYNKFAFLARYNRTRRFFSSYYVVRSWFFPWNRVYVRNLGRTWNDRDYVMFHACFTLLCDFCEGEFVNISWDEYVEWITEESVKFEAWRKDNPSKSVIEYNGSLLKNNLAKHYQELDRLYKWYNSVNWEKPCGASDSNDFERICNDNLESLIRLRGYLWT